MGYWEIQIISTCKTKVKHISSCLPLFMFASSIILSKCNKPLVKQHLYKMYWIYLLIPKLIEFPKKIFKNFFSFIMRIFPGTTSAVVCRVYFPILQFASKSCSKHIPEKKCVGEDPEFSHLYIFKFEKCRKTPASLK